MQQELWCDGHKLVAVLRNPGTTGRPFVFLHGVTGSIELWQPEQMTPFLGQGPCYSLSLPGHYPAVFPPGYTEREITAEMMVRVLAAAIRQLTGDQPVTLVGHSTGGFAALALAACEPGLVDRLICISGFARGCWQGTLGFGQSLGRRGRWGKFLFWAMFTSNRQNRTLQALTWLIYMRHPRQVAASADFKKLHRAFYPNYRRLDLWAMADYFSAMLNIDITNWLSHITVPTLVLTGAQDPTVPASEANHIAQHIPQATLAVVEDCGHFLHLEQNGRYNETVSAWLQENEADGKRN